MIPTNVITQRQPNPRKKCSGAPIVQFCPSVTCFFLDWVSLALGCDVRWFHMFSYQTRFFVSQTPKHFEDTLQKYGGRRNKIDIKPKTALVTTW